MDALGKLIRQAMMAKEMSSTDLANIIGLHPRTIDNVIYGKSKKLSLIKKISNGLDVDFLKDFPLEHLASTERLSLDPKDKDEPLNLEAHSLATTLITRSLNEESVICTKKQLDVLVTIIYGYMQEYPNKSKISWIDFAKGMIRLGKKCFYFKNNIIDRSKS